MERDSLIVLKKADIMETVYPNKMFDAMSTKKPIILAIGGVSKKLVVEDAQSGIYSNSKGIYHGKTGCFQKNFRIN